MPCMSLSKYNSQKVSFFPDRTQWCSFQIIQDFSYSRCVKRVFYSAFVWKGTDMCKHRFWVQLLQNPPLCSSTVRNTPGCFQQFLSAVQHHRSHCSWLLYNIPTVYRVHPQNVRFQNVRFQTVRFQNVWNVRLTKRQVYKTSGLQNVRFTKPRALKRPVAKKHPYIFCTFGWWKSAGSVAAMFAGKVMAVFYSLF